MANPTVTKTPRLPVALAEALEALARATGKSENAIIIEALQAYLKQAKIEQP